MITDFISRKYVVVKLHGFCVACVPFPSILLMYRCTNLCCSELLILDSFDRIIDSKHAKWFVQELLQNAEDAGAHEVKFIYDEHSYPTSKLHHPDMANFQVNDRTSLQIENLKFDASGIYKSPLSNQNLELILCRRSVVRLLWLIRNTIW